MTTQTTVSELKINKLTKQQYEGITPSSTELYFITDDSGVTSDDITGALGYTPYDGSTNPNGYITSSSVGNGTITINQGGVQKGTFTTNQSGSTTINLDAGGSGSMALGDLTNVDISSPTTGQNLTYDSNTDKWKNTSPASIGNGTITINQGGTTKGTFTTNQSGNTTINLDAGGVASLALGDLTNVTLTNPTTGQNLTYDSSTQKWKNTSTSATVAWGGITGTLSSQTDLNTALGGKQPTIDSSHKLSSDLVDDTNNTHKFATSSQLTQISTNATNISTINGKIPSEASSSNQLADKNFVNTSVSTNTANFIGTFASVAELNAYSGTKTNNDYAFVTSTDTAGNTVYNRYKYSASTTSWLFEYSISNPTFTADEWASIRSGCTTTTVSLAASALQSSDVTSSYSPTGTSPINGTAVASAVSGLQPSSTAVTHTASTAVGSATKPAYIASNGVATACDYSLGTNVPSDAVFTDTTYSNFTGAGASSAGSNGLVPAPASGYNEAYLRGDGFWVKPTDSISSGSSALLTSGGAYTNLVRRLSDSSATGSATQGIYVDANGQIQACTAVTSTYSATGMAPVNGTAVASAIGGFTPIMQPFTVVSGTHSGSIAIPVTQTSTIWNITPVGAITEISFNVMSNFPANKAFTFELCISMTDTIYSIGWDNTSITWQDGELPDMSNVGTYYFAFRTTDGANWIGNLQGVW